MVRSWCDLTIDGEVLFEDEVMSVTFNDKAGTRSDLLTVTLLPTVKRPHPNAEVTCVLFNDLGEELDCGIFHVQSTTRSNNKDLSFSATGVEFNKEQKKKYSQNYEGTKLSSIVSLIAKRLGKKVKFQTVDQKVESIYQTDETDIQFLDRLATQYDVLFSIKNGVVYFVSKNDDELPLYTVDASKCSSISVKFSTKMEYKSCEISYYDRRLSKDIKVKIDEGEPVLKVKCACKNKEEAKLKGKAKLAVAQRGTVSGNLTTIGQKLYAGTKLGLINTFQNEDDNEYSIESATHRYTRGGDWTVDVEFENFKLDKEK